MSGFAFILTGPPLPWMRAGRRGATTFTPREQRAYQKELKALALSVRPADWNQHARYLVWLTASWPDASARDLDNVQKQVGDALNGIVWHDDSRIVAWRPVIAPVSMQPQLGVAVEIVEPVQHRRMAREVQARVDSLLSASAPARQGVAPAGRKVRRAW